MLDFLALKSDLPVLIVCEELPEFPGGQKALMSFISRNINYPTREAMNGIEGIAVVSYVFAEDGGVTDVKIFRERKIKPLLPCERRP